MAKRAQQPLSTVTQRGGISQQRAQVAPQPRSAARSGVAEQMTDSGASNPRPMSAEQHEHFKGLVSATIDNAAAVGHGHMVGSQGHAYVPSDAHKQTGNYLPQGVGRDFARVPQNTSSDGSGSSDFSDPSPKDYGVADCKGD